MPDPIPVRFRDCACPGSPHPDGDVAYLRPYLDYRGGAAVMAAIAKVGDEQERFAELVGPVYIERGVEGWNLLDEAGEPVPCTPEALDALRWEEAYELAQKADDTYGPQVLAPFLKRMPMSSKPGPTNGSTHRRAPSSRKRRSPSASSS